MPAPLLPSSEEAHEWAVEELSRKVYSSDPTLWQLIMEKIRDFFLRLVIDGGSFHGVVLPLVLGAVIVALIIGILIYAKDPRRGSRTAPEAAGVMWDADDERSAAAMREAARAAAAQADYSLAVIESFRATVRTLQERGVAKAGSGMTAIEAAALVSRHFPAYSERLRTTAAHFNGALYGTRRLTQANYLDAANLDEALMAEPAPRQVVQ